MKRQRGAVYIMSISFQREAKVDVRGPSSLSSRGTSARAGNSCGNRRNIGANTGLGEIIA